MKNISAVIVVKNNPLHLPKVITSVEDLVKEIIIVDIGIDNVLKAELKKNKIVKIIEIKNDVPYVELIREKTKDFAKSEYIFFACTPLPNVSAFVSQPKGSKPVDLRSIRLIKRPARPTSEAPSEAQRECSKYYLSIGRPLH